MCPVLPLPCKDTDPRWILVWQCHPLLPGHQPWALQAPFQSQCKSGAVREMGILRGHKKVEGKTDCGNHLVCLYNVHSHILHTYLSIQLFIHPSIHLSPFNYPSVSLSTYIYGVCSEYSFFPPFPPPSAVFCLLLSSLERDLGPFCPSWMLYSVCVFPSAGAAHPCCQYPNSHGEESVRDSPLTWEDSSCLLQPESRSLQFKCDVTQPNGVNTGTTGTSGAHKLCIVAFWMALMLLQMPCEV